MSAGCVSGGGGGSGLTRANPELQETRTARRKRRGLVVRERVWVPPHETSSHVVYLEVAETFAVLGVDVGAMRMALGLSGNERQAQHVVGFNVDGLWNRPTCETRVDGIESVSYKNGTKPDRRTQTPNLKSIQPNLDCTS